MPRGTILPQPADSNHTYMYIHMYVPGEIKIHDDSERSLASLAFYK